MTEKDYQALINFIRMAASEKFFGEISMRFKNGEIYHIIKSQSIKLEDIE